jgi:hypothetical protein
MTSMIRLDATPTPCAGATDNFAAIPPMKTRQSSGKSSIKGERSANHKFNQN